MIVLAAMLSLLWLLLHLNCVSCQPTVDDETNEFTSATSAAAASCSADDFQQYIRTHLESIKTVLQQQQQQLNCIEQLQSQVKIISSRMESIQAVNNQSISHLELLVKILHGELELYTVATRYYDIQFDVSPLIVNKPRQHLASQLACQCSL